MTIQVELNPEIEARLVAGAQARGISVEEYAETLLKEAVALQVEPSGRLSIKELHAMLDAIAEGLTNCRVYQRARSAVRAFMRTASRWPVRRTCWIAIF